MLPYWQFMQQCQQGTRWEKCLNCGHFVDRAQISNPFVLLRSRTKLIWFAFQVSQCSMCTLVVGIFATPLHALTSTSMCKLTHKKSGTAKLDFEFHPPFTFYSCLAEHWRSIAHIVRATCVGKNWHAWPPFFNFRGRPQVLFFAFLERPQQALVFVVFGCHVTRGS